LESSFTKELLPRWHTSAKSRRSSYLGDGTFLGIVQHLCGENRRLSQFPDESGKNPHFYYAVSVIQLPSFIFFTIKRELSCI
jgi:hypothetical protein